MPKKPLFLFSAFSLALIGAVYWPTLFFDFVNLDDDKYVYNNAFVLEGLNWQTFIWSLKGIVVSNWHPMTMLSFLLESHFFGANPQIHHLSNVLLHWGNSVLIFLLMARLDFRPLQSASIALLFALHPLQVESVAWISQRKTLLCVFFWALSLLFYLRKENQKHALKWSLLFYAFSLLSKPLSVSAPFLILFIEYFVKKTKQWKLSLPFWALSALFCLITLSTQHSSGAMNEHATVSFFERLQTALMAYSWYLYKTLAPMNLYVQHIFPKGGWPLPLLLSCLALWISLGVIAFRKKKALAAYLFFLISLLPMVGIVQVGQQPWADRYIYISLLAPLMILASLHKGAPKILLALSLVAAVLSFQQVQHWKNTYTLYKRTLSFEPEHAIVHNNLGGYLMSKRKWSEAEIHLKLAASNRNNYHEALANLGFLNQSQKKYTAAKNYLEKAISIKEDPRYTQGLGQISLKLDDPNNAKVYFEKTLSLNPSLKDSAHGLAKTYAQLGRNKDALFLYQQLIRENPKRGDYQREARELLERK